MSEESESARLLKDDVYPEGVFVSENFYGSRKNRSSIFLVSILALSIVLNLVQGIGIIIREYTRENVIESVSDLRSNFAGLKENEVRLEWNQESPYTSSNSTQRHRLWDAINHDSGIVAVPETWAQEKGLPMGSLWPWDTSKRIYFVNAYHGLHCLKNIYRAFMEYQEGRPQSLMPEHIIHCLDQLRADVTCHADDTLRTTTPDMRPVTGDNQVRSCRNWHALEAWTLAHPGCYRYGDPSVEDVKPTQIPRMRYCPEGTPELETIREYFNQSADWKPAEEQVWSWFNAEE